MNEMDRTEALRKLLELGLAAGRQRQSSLTGFIHHTYHGQEDEARDGIPILENFLFALTLLRQRTSESMAEGKALLERLLHFQKRDGERANFPVYLHEFPECKDRNVAAHLLPIFFWVLRSFQQILGAELRQQLESTAAALLSHCLHHSQEKMPTYPIAVKIAAAAQAFNRESGLLLESFRNEAAWQSPAAIAETLVALQVAYPKLSESPWSSFWEQIGTSWHRPTCSYCGPAVKELQSAFEPQPTLYDLYLGSLSGHFSARALKPDLIHLQAALIQPSEELLPTVEQRAYAYALQPIGEQQDKGTYPFRLLYGDPKRVHTLACSSSNATQIDFLERAGGVDFIFHLAVPANLEEREKSRDLAFYLDQHEGLSFRVNGQPSNTFKIGDQLAIENRQLKFTIRFTLEEGEGEFFGHWMLGNRPSQIALKGENRFQAYDWQLFLRTVRRTAPCIVRVNLEIEEKR
jgi:hypothetical protein